MKVSMIGCGKLGLPCAEVMAEFYDVIGYDVKSVVSDKITIVSNVADAVVGVDIIFVAVPTPHDAQYDGKYECSYLPPKNFDYSIVQSVLTEINQYLTQSQLVVLISTVLPGTVRKHLAPQITRGRFIYNPYLIAMGSVAHDMINPECLIIGTETGDETGDARILGEFYAPMLQNYPRINIGTWEEAESIKIFYNTWISAKISLVNMIQDVAEKLGNMNVDVVTDALKHATQRITGPKYMTAGMGDGGACHPRDNIALRWMAQELNLGYDLFHAIMVSREKQAYNLAEKLLTLSHDHKLPVIIHGRTYKPNVPYTDGSYSELIMDCIKSIYELLPTYNPWFADPQTGDFIADGTSGIILMAHNESVTYGGDKQIRWYFKPGPGSVIVDPWRQITEVEDCTVIHYGNTRDS